VAGILANASRAGEPLGNPQTEVVKQDGELAVELDTDLGDPRITEAGELVAGAGRR
jgi:hypothetical protein